MNLAESARFREALAKIESLIEQVKDLSRRVDELSAADRKRIDTLSLKKAVNG